MSKKRRDYGGKFAPAASPKWLAATWISAFLSLGLLGWVATAVRSDLGTFRHCSTNTTLLVQNCGKQSLNVGDFILIALFIICAVLVVTLFTAAWRMIRKKSL